MLKFWPVYLIEKPRKELEIVNARELREGTRAGTLERKRCIVLRWTCLPGRSPKPYSRPAPLD